MVNAHWTVTVITMETRVLAFHDCHKISELTKVQRGKFILIHSFSRLRLQSVVWLSDNGMARVL